MTPAAWVARLLEPQPDPTGDGPSVTAAAFNAATDPRVRALLLERRRQGLARYGRDLTPGNGRDAAADLVAELVDGVNYASELWLEGGPDVRARVEAALVDVLDALGWRT